MGSWYEICPIGDDAVWLVWAEGGVERKYELSEAQRKWLAAVTERQNSELQDMLKDITKGICAGEA